MRHVISGLSASKSFSCMSMEILICHQHRLINMEYEFVVGSPIVLRVYTLTHLAHPGAKSDEAHMLNRTCLISPPQNLSNNCMQAQSIYPVGIAIYLLPTDRFLGGGKLYLVYYLKIYNIGPRTMI